MKKLLQLSAFLFFLVVQVNAQTITNSINIGSALQNTNTATTFNQWNVTAMSADMQTAPCFNNTTAPPNPATINNPNPVPPVAIGQPAVLLGMTGIYGNLSCFPFNTIYTPWMNPGQGNVVNCTMTISRTFMICSNNNEQVNFNFTIRCDDGVNRIWIDGAPANAIFTGPIAAIAPVLTINVNRILAPGLHTIDIQCYNWEDPNGSQVTVNGVARQWNPFLIGINGTINTGNNVLLNAAAPAIAQISGPAEVCAGSTIMLSNATPGGTWASSNTGIATIDQSGTVTGVAPGNSTISYSIAQGNCTNTANFNVEVTSCHCEDSCNWSLTGNTFVKSWNFIGSLNNADFKVRTNNTQRMVVTAAGDIGINTASPAKLLEVNGEARIGLLPAAAVNDRVVFANAFGDLRSLSATGNTNQYLSGNGTWQTLGGGGGTVGADQGLTLDNNNTVLLGDVCNNGGGQFAQSREINMNDQNLYFNSSRIGKLYMGNTQSGHDACRTLYTRLEISSAGLRSAVNDYVSPDPSTSGLRFTDLTPKTDPIANKTGGVLSLDLDGDVIWVKACCDNGGIEMPQLKDITERLSKLEAQLAETKNRLAQMDVLLEKNNIILLDQNVPNPFNESTVITYLIPKGFTNAQLIFASVKGDIIKTVDIKNSGKGQLNVSAAGISSGMYTYSLMVDGKIIETKKMVKQ